VANDVKAVKIWEAGCIEIWASLKGKPILLCGRTEHTKRISIITAVYDSSSPSESIILIREGSADSIVVRVSDTREYSLNVDEHYSQLATVVSGEHGAVSKQVSWCVYGNGRIR
jgi:hypothetical protein